PEAAWLPDALHYLGRGPALVDEAEVLALLAELRAPGHASAARVAAALARATRSSATEPELADRLRVWAALLACEGIDAAREGRLAADGATELAKSVIAALEQELHRYGAIGYRTTDGGLRVPVTGAPPSPIEVWNPVLGTLAYLGSPEARLWMLRNGRPES